MSRRQRQRANARPWNQQRLEPSQALEEALAALAQDRAQRDQQPQPKAPTP
jgi:hypothetical protein